MKKEQENKFLSILCNSKKSFIYILESRFIRFSFKKEIIKEEKKIAFILRSSEIIACSNTGVILLNNQKKDKETLVYLEKNINVLLNITEQNFRFFFINKKDKVKLKHIFLNNKNKIFQENNKIPFVSIEEKYIFSKFKKIIKED